jgi:NADH dehydrogenase
MGRTIVLGCGDAGLIATAYLERAGETDVTVVSEHDDHVFSFLLYHVLEGMAFDEARVDLQDAFEDRDVTFLQGLVEGLDTDEKRIDLRSGALYYDSLLVTVGSVTKYDVDDRGHVFDLRTDAREIRGAMNAPDVRDAVVVGGGPVGVETTATLSSVTDSIDVTLVTSSRRPLSEFPRRAGELVEREFRRRGVDLRTETRVSDVTADGVVYERGSAERSDLTVWAGGVRPNPVIDEFDLPRSDRGLRVDRHLRCRGTDDVYAAGDVVDYPGKVKDGVSAGLEARTAAKNLIRDLRGRRPKEHEQRFHPRIVYLGGNTALLAAHGIVHLGRIPALLRDVSVEGYPFFWKHLY